VGLLPGVGLRNQPPEPRPHASSGWFDAQEPHIEPKTPAKPADGLCGQRLHRLVRHLRGSTPRPNLGRATVPPGPEVFRYGSTRRDAVLVSVLDGESVAKCLVELDSGGEVEVPDAIVI
jgi:hypothetical protein